MGGVLGKDADVSGKAWNPRNHSRHARKVDRDDGIRGIAMALGEA